MQLLAQLKRISFSKGSQFTPACGKSALRVAPKKMQKRMEVRMLNCEQNDEDSNAVIDVDASDASS